jgi:ABC-type branched-subunit amino acid transport system ATPase component
VTVETPVLQVESLRAGYEDLVILDDVSIAVPAGAIVSIIGPNGAGKSTLLKAIYGIAAIRAGRMRLSLDGQSRDIRSRPPHALTALGMNYVPQIENVFATLSVLENLQIGAVTDRAALPRTLETIFSTFPFLRAARHRPAGALSGGQRQMLALARALMSEPRLLLLDEPSAGLAPQAVDDLFERLRAIHGLGVSILMAEQNARRALAMSDYAYVLENGRNRYEGSGQDLLHDERVVELYLGRRRTAERTSI